MNAANRPFEGQALQDVLDELAQVNVMAFDLKNDLEPLTEEDAAAGAQPLSLGQIQATLDEIQNRVASVALLKLRATGDEWLAANDRIE